MDGTSKKPCSLYFVILLIGRCFFFFPFRLFLLEFFSIMRLFFRIVMVYKNS